MGGLAWGSTSMCTILKILLPLCRRGYLSWVPAGPEDGRPELHGGQPDLHRHQQWLPGPLQQHRPDRQHQGWPPTFLLMSPLLALSGAAVSLWYGRIVCSVHHRACAVRIFFFSFACMRVWVHAPTSAVLQAELEDALINYAFVDYGEYNMLDYTLQIRANSSVICRIFLDVFLF